MVEEMGLPLHDPQCLFDLEFFRDDPHPFYAFAHKLYPPTSSGGFVPSATHRFLAQLAARRKLLRCYTQNIDGLEVAAGVPSKLVVPCHGTLASATCLKCKSKACSEGSEAMEALKRAVAQGKVATCGLCLGGVLKPDVTFFGEGIAARVKRSLDSDRLKCDLLIVLGTSLQVRPMSHVVGSWLPAHVPQVLLNLNPVRPLPALSEGFDLSLLGPCDDLVPCLEERLQWTQKQLPCQNKTTLECSGANLADVPSSSSSSSSSPSSSLPQPPSSSTPSCASSSSSSPPSLTEERSTGLGGEPAILVQQEERVWTIKREGGSEGLQSDGARIDRSSSSSSSRNDDDDGHAEVAEEVVTCDNCAAAIILNPPPPVPPPENGSGGVGCGGEAEGGGMPCVPPRRKGGKRSKATGWSCFECFDFDLCPKCYSQGNNAHAREKKHSFRPLR